MVMHSSNISYGQGQYSYLLQSVITYPGGPTKETVDSYFTHIGPHQCGTQ